MHILMFFIDGLGLGEESEEKNPLVKANMPVIRSLLGGKSLIKNTVGKYKGAWLKSLDAMLGVEGLPQSATGQTSLFTGQNAAKLIGRHLQAYPTPVLRQILAENSFLRQIQNKGGKVTFANGFSPDYFLRPMALRGRHSASTLAMLATGKELRQGLEMISKGDALYHDLTNQGLRERGWEVPMITPVQAGGNLARIVMEHHCTLYEYFHTDRVGHKQEWQSAYRILEALDTMLGAFLKELTGTDFLLVLVSDHGNLEDLSCKTHTKNPVPCLLVGQYSEAAVENLGSLTDVAPFLLRQWERRQIWSGVNG